MAMLLLALSGAARSNGAINAGYFCFQAILQVYDAIIQKKRHRVQVRFFSLLLFHAIVMILVLGEYTPCVGDIMDWFLGK